MDRTLCTEVRWICKHRKITHFWHLTSMSVDFYIPCVYRPHTHQMGGRKEKDMPESKNAEIPQFRTNCPQTYGYNNTLHDLPFLSPIFCCYVHKILQNSVNQENHFDWRVYWSPDGVSMNSNRVSLRHYLIFFDTWVFKQKLCLKRLSEWQRVQAGQAQHLRQRQTGSCSRTTGTVFSNMKINPMFWSTNAWNILHGKQRMVCIYKEKSNRREKTILSLRIIQSIMKRIYVNLKINHQTPKLGKVQRKTTHKPTAHAEHVS